MIDSKQRGAGPSDDGRGAGVSGGAVTPVGDGGGGPERMETGVIDSASPVRSAENVPDQ